MKDTQHNGKEKDKVQNDDLQSPTQKTKEHVDEQH
jgi:hypothetical protein